MAHSTLRSTVRDIVAKAAPQELPILDGVLSARDDAGVSRLLNPRKVRRDPLGFGFTEVAALVSPVVWLVVDEAARRATGAATDSAIVRARSVSRRVLRRSPEPSRPMPSLSPQQINTVHQRVRERAQVAGLDEIAAEQLADAVVSRLARESAEDLRGSEQATSQTP
jgi:hypothetical protein